jgi:serine/threonine protein kinase
MEIALGEVVLDHFRVVERLHSTRIAEILRAEHVTARREVLLKVLRVSSDPRHAGRFEREAHMMAKVSHPGVVRLEAYGFVAGSRPAIAMELVRGERLDGHLQRVGPMAWPEAIKASLSLLAALETMHATGVVHRNVAPPNIALTPEGGAKLINLDLATLCEGYHTRLTWTGEVVGIPHYVAPEGVMRGQADERSDVYGMAVTLYQMISGRLPFPADSLSGLLDAFERLPDPPVAPPAQLWVPPQVQDAILAALAVDPSLRTASARRMASQLREARRGARVSPPTRPSEPPPISRCLVVGRVPEGGPTAAEVATWAGAQLRDRGRAVLLPEPEFALVLPAPDRAYAEEVAAMCQRAVQQRFGTGVVVAWAAATSASLPDRFIEGGPIPPLVYEVLRHLRRS